MTALGAAVYGGFFGLAALWLAATSPDKRADRAQPDDATDVTPALSGSCGTPRE